MNEDGGNCNRVLTQWRAFPCASKGARMHACCLFLTHQNVKLYRLTLSYWLCLVVVVVVLGARDFFYKGYQRAFHPQLHHVLQEIEKFHLGDLNQLEIPLPPQPHMFMKETIVDLPEHADDNDDIELMQRVRRATRTISDMFIPKGLGHAYDHSDLQTVIEERNIILGRRIGRRVSRLIFSGHKMPENATESGKKTEGHLGVLEEEEEAEKNVDGVVHEESVTIDICGEQQSEDGLKQQK